MQRPKRPGRYHQHDGCKCIIPVPILTGNGEETTRPGTPTPEIFLPPHHHQSSGSWIRDCIENRHDAPPRYDPRKPQYKFQMRHFRDCNLRRRLPGVTWTPTTPYSSTLPSRNLGDSRHFGQSAMPINFERDTWMPTSRDNYLPLPNLAPIFTSQLQFKGDQAHPPRPGPPPPPALHVQNNSIPSTSTSTSRIESGTDGQNKNDVMNRLLSVLECPVCFEYVSPPIMQCQEGHLVCSVCRSRLDLCPKCRQPFSDIRARALEQLAEVIQYPCHNAGCSVMLPLTERHAHEAVCSKRQYSCTIEPCNWLGIRSDLPAHIEQQHPQRFVKSSTYALNLTVTQNTGNDEKIFLMQCHDETFHCVMAVDCQQDLFLGFVMLVGSNHNATNFEFELKFENEEPPYTSVSVTRAALEESVGATLAGINTGVNAVVLSFATLRDTMKETGQGTSVLPVSIAVRRREPATLPFVPVSVVMSENEDPTTSE